MSELRWHPLLGQWTIVATHRQDRTYKPPAAFCPLCPTRPGEPETELPHGDFDVAVFENKFPSLRREPPDPEVAGTELTPVAPARGICEVVVYSPDHHRTLAEQSVEQIRRLVEVWADRFGELGAREEIEYVMIFENRGDAVGVTLHHPHGQIYAFPYVPPIPQKEQEQSRRHLERTGRCLLCDVLAQERADGRRIVAANDRFTAAVPFFARYPFEVLLSPHRHMESILEADERERWALASLLKRLISAYDGLWGFHLPYMMVLHQAPTDGRPYPECHWHVEFYPLHRTADKLKYRAGCESGAGTFITDAAPEEMAAMLRRAAGDEKEASHA